MDADQERKLGILLGVISVGLGIKKYILNKSTPSTEETTSTLPSTTSNLLSTTLPSSTLPSSTLPSTTFAPVTCAATVGVFDDFDNGNIGNVTRVGNTFTMTFGPGAGNLWFHVKVCNLKDVPCTFILKQIRCDQYPAPTPASTHQIVTSTDRLNWTKITTGTRINCTNYQPGTCDTSSEYCDYRWTYTPTTNLMYFAFWYPYTNWQLDNFLAANSLNPYLRVKSIGNTYFNIPEKMLTITDYSVLDTNKKCVYYLAREDAWETNGTLQLMGSIKYLLSSDAFASKIRKNIIFKCVPIVSVSAVNKGVINGMRDENPANTQSLTRSWTGGTMCPGTPPPCGTWTNPISPLELENIKNEMREWQTSGKKVHLIGRNHSQPGGADFISHNPTLRSIISSKGIPGVTVISTAPTCTGSYYQFVNKLYEADGYHTCPCGTSVCDSELPSLLWETGVRSIPNIDLLGEETIKAIAQFFNITPP